MGGTVHVYIKWRILNTSGFVQNDCCKGSVLVMTVKLEIVAYQK